MRRTVVWIGFVVGLVWAHYIPIGHPVPLEHVVWCLIGGTLTLLIDWTFTFPWRQKAKQGCYCEGCERLRREARYGR
jgi:hypothetical protein